MTKRNDPCSCGSGKKYKKCHLRTDEAGAGGLGMKEGRPGWADLDQPLTMKVIDFGERRFPIELGEWARVGFDTHQDPIYNQFVIPWLAWHTSYGDGRRLGEHFLDHKGGRLSARERGLAEAQLRSWIGVWEVEDFVPGESLDIVDRLSGESRHVVEISGSRDARPGMTFLARIVDFEGASLICGMHPRPLRPTDTAPVLRGLKRFLGTRRKNIPLEIRRHPDTAVEILEIWESVVDDLDARVDNLKLCNSDGDPLLLTVDRARLPRSERSRVESHLRGSSDVHEEERDDGSADWVILDEQETVLGCITFDGNTIRIEANSVRRADTLRERVSTVVTDTDIRWIRDHSDPTSSAASRHDVPDERDPEPEEAAEIVLEVKRRHYDAWIDESLPALGGRTPREAVATRKGREDVEQLIKQIDYIEAGFPEDRRYDTSELRKALGVKPKRQSAGRNVEYD